MHWWLCCMLWGLGPPATASERRTPVVEAVERALPSVLIVEVKVERQSPFLLGSSVARSQGTGVVIDPEGVVITNAHVVEGALAVSVRREDGPEWDARVMALEPDLDLAVLQVEGAPELPAVPLGDSDDLMLGETAVAIGNPLGLGLAVSTGVVSSLRREVELRDGLRQAFIQTDAAINPGNSGGALVNLDGELIGINTAIRADAEGIAFAIPVNRAAKVAADLLNYGIVRAPWLGVDVLDIDSRRLRGTPLEEGAVLVERVWPGGPADKLGMRRGDLLYELGGRPVASRADLNAKLAEHPPGAKLRVAWAREDGLRFDQELVSTDVPDKVVVKARREVLGIDVFERGGGLAVSAARPDGSWSKARLRVGDVILAADGRPLDEEDDLVDAIRRARAQHRSTVLFTVQRGRYIGHMAVSI